MTACSDGVVRIWTVHQDKIADPLELESYAAQLSQYTLSRFGIQTLLICLSHHIFGIPINLDCISFGWHKAFVWLIV